MSKKLFVGNLPFDVNDADLATVLGVAGKVIDAKVIVNKKTGRSKGYGFVEMETEAMAQEAVQKFEGATLNERALTVQLATPKQEAEAKSEEKAEAGPEASVVEAPVAEAPVAEAPVAEAPAAEASASEAPAENTPVENT